jgi:hypothetical protein
MTGDSHVLVDLRPIFGVGLFCFLAVGLLKAAYWQWRRGARSRAYRKMLHSERWAARRTAYYLLHEKKCWEKGLHWGPIDLDHVAYVWGRHPADYGDKLLRPSCRYHHKRGAPFISEQEARRIEHR